MSFGELTEDKNDFFEPKKEDETSFKILLPDEDENTFKTKKTRSKTDNRLNTKFYQKKNPQLLRESSSRKNDSYNRRQAIFGGNLEEAKEEFNKLNNDGYEGFQFFQK